MNCVRCSQETDKYYYVAKGIGIANTRSLHNLMFEEKKINFVKQKAFLCDKCRNYGWLRQILMESLMLVLFWSFFLWYYFFNLKGNLTPTSYVIFFIPVILTITFGGVIPYLRKNEKHSTSIAVDQVIKELKKQNKGTRYYTQEDYNRSMRFGDNP